MKWLIKKLSTHEKNELKNPAEDNPIGCKNIALANFFKTINQIGFSPKFIIDVGANKGTWTREVITYLPDAKYLLIEPQKNLQPFFLDLLELENVTCLAVGAGIEDTTGTFTFVDRDDSCSFVYSKQYAKDNGYTQHEIPIKTLNTIIRENDLPIPDLIKIDAEGLDLEVIEGASELLGHTEIILVEAAVGNNIYKNTMARVVELMDKKNYRLFDITELNRPFHPEILWLVELAFIKKNGWIDNNTLKM